MLARSAAALFAALFLMGLGPVVAHAQDVDRIAAVVNDDIISIRDLESRMKLALVVSGLPDNLENRRRAVPQVLRKMIDERLQMQEGTRLKLNVNTDELQRSIANIERQNRMPPGALITTLTNSGVDPDSFKDQIRAEIMWVKVSQRTIQTQVRVGEDEINERLETLKLQLGQPEYLLAQISLPADNPRQDEEARRLGERLLDQLKAGAPFPALARQFSQDANAGNGGSLGWLPYSSLEDELKDPVKALQKGQVSGLIRTATGYAVVLMQDQRITGSNQGPEQILNLSQVHFPLPKANAPPREQLMAKAAELTAKLRTCREIEELGTKLLSEKSGNVPRVSLGELPPNLQPILSTQPVNQPTPPQDVGDGLLVVMVCSRTSEGAAGLPGRDSIRRGIENERLELMAKRYLRDLRRAAFVDLRL
ncbi:Peptidyl-prolyl cis-trans isomerase [Candidatus Terasakiella magnetica]|nr:Peptidyl-prolyl cis-trans isomerase [Candidatus Terasakiella magnetica]